MDTERDNYVEVDLSEEIYSESLLRCKDGCQRAEGSPTGG